VVLELHHLLGDGQNRTFSLELVRVLHLDSCPFAIEYPAELLEQIRLAVMEAFFAIPRGGLEIGGVLFGRYREGSLQIDAFRMLQCEHAAGPSFTLSEGDRVRLRELLASTAAEGLHPVGWFRSRTRSEISLSGADIGLHNTYFGEPWQVVWVLRPEVTRPMCAGFFFRRGGAFESCPEFEVEPRGKFPTGPAPDAIQAGQVRDMPHMAAPRAVSRALWVFALLVGLAGAGMAAHQYLELKTPVEEALWLGALDRGGQLQLTWDHAARPIRAARHAMLEITDGPQRFSTDLQTAQVQRGSFYYARQTERVDIRLTVIEANGRSTEAYTIFFGRLPSSEAEPQAELDPAGVKSGGKP
jgi:hypothetical protein